MVTNLKLSPSHLEALMRNHVIAFYIKLETHLTSINVNDT